jgi:hypothetical protein
MSEDLAVERKRKRKRPAARRAQNDGKYPEGARLAAKIHHTTNADVALTFGDLSLQTNRNSLTNALNQTKEQKASEVDIERATELYNFLLPKIVGAVVNKLERDNTTKKRLRRKKLAGD